MVLLRVAYIYYCQIAWFAQLVPSDMVPLCWDVHIMPLYAGYMCCDIPCNEPWFIATSSIVALYKIVRRNRTMLLGYLLEMHESLKKQDQQFKLCCCMLFEYLHTSTGGEGKVRRGYRTDESSRRE